MERDEYRSLLIAARPTRWATIKVNHAAWVGEGEYRWNFSVWGGGIQGESHNTLRDLAEGHYTHVLIVVAGAGDDLDGEYTGEVIDFDPYRGEFYVEFS